MNYPRLSNQHCQLYIFYCSRVSLPFVFNYRDYQIQDWETHSITVKCPGKQICDCISYDIIISCTVPKCPVHEFVMVRVSPMLSRTVQLNELVLPVDRWDVPVIKDGLSRGDRGWGAFKYSIFIWSTEKRHPGIFVIKSLVPVIKIAIHVPEFPSIYCLCPWCFHLALIIQSGEHVLNALILKSGNISEDTAHFLIFLIILTWQILFKNQTYYICMTVRISGWIQYIFLFPENF